MIAKRCILLTFLAALATAHGAWAKPAPKPKPKPNYIYAENGTYYYEAAISRQQREAGYVAGDAVGYRYYGINASGEYVLARVVGNGAVTEFIYCKKPCRVIRTSSGNRFVNNSRLLVSSAFADAFRGRLRNTNPDLPKPRPKSAVSIPSRSPFDVSGTAAGIIKTANGIAIRSAANSPVYATADGLVEFVGQLAGYGGAIRLGHGGEIQTLYGNLGRMTVSPKATVTKGQVIGFVGAPTNGGNAELLYEIRVAGNAVDPMPYIGKDDAEWRALFQTWQSLDRKQ